MDARSETLDAHEGYEQLLRDMTDHLEGTARVSRDVLGDLLTRLLIAAPGTAARADLEQGTMLSGPKPLSPATVTKALAVLSDAGLVSRVPLVRKQRQRTGRPAAGLAIGSEQWALLGVQVQVLAGKPAHLVGVLTGLNAMPLDAGFEQPMKRQLEGDVTNWFWVADEVARMADEMRRLWFSAGEGAPRRVLGLGLEVPGHVHAGHVLQADQPGFGTSWRGAPVAQRLRTQLGIPVVVDNDANLVAVRESYRRKQAHLSSNAALVVVFPEGVGAGLITNGTVYRGGRGMAGELGHVPVGDLQVGDPQETEIPAACRQPPTFTDPCYCGAPGHVDCYATPARIAAELGVPIADFHLAASQPALSGQQFTIEGRAFARAGAALGVGIVSLLNILNPSPLLLLLPQPLAAATPGDGSAAGAYRGAVERVIARHQFSTAYEDARHGSNSLQIKSLSVRAGAAKAARNAALRVIDEFLAHAHQADDCAQYPTSEADVRLVTFPGVTTLPADPRQQLRTEVEQLRQDITRIVARADPEGLLAAGAPADEYDREAEDLLRLVRQGRLDEQSVTAVWREWFGAGSRLLLNEGSLHDLTHALQSARLPRRLGTLPARTGGA